MLSKNSGQLHLHDAMVYNQIIPKDHLLLKIESVFNFDFVYDLVAERYSSNLGRSSKDPVTMVKMLLLEYLYKLSDVELKKRAQTDVAFRWFLKLSLSDEIPDDSTVSHFRIHRLDTSQFEDLFNDIINQCMEKDLVKAQRFQVDSTNIDANVNYPRKKKLLRQAFERVTREISKFDILLAENSTIALDEELKNYHDGHEKFTKEAYYQIVNKHLNDLYLKIHDRIPTNKKLADAVTLCKRMSENKLGKIISVVDQDARVAHKSPGKIKTGYKNNIIIDEDSELILAYEVTPFNVNDYQKLPALVDKVTEKFGLIPKEISADKGYATTDIRAYLKDHEIVSNIDFYNIVSKGRKYFSIADCTFEDDGNILICPHGAITKGFTPGGYLKRKYRVDSCHCSNCPLRDKCIIKYGKVYKNASKTFEAPERFDAILKDMARVATDAFQEAKNARFKIERRFATGVRNHNMRRSRFIGLDATTKHVALANTTINIKRAIFLLENQRLSAPNFE